jgi:hypothetical protein
VNTLYCLDFFELHQYIFIRALPVQEVPWRLKVPTIKLKPPNTIGDLRTKQTTPPRIKLQATIDSTNIKQKDNHMG